MRLRYRGLSSGTIDLTDRDEVLVGRSKSCAVRTDDQSLSRKHARIERDGDSWRITDLRSQHGVRVGGRQVTAYTLRVGEPVHLGEVEIVLEEPPPQLAIAVHDWQVARMASQAITIGNAFAFVGPELIEQPSLRWLKAFVPANAIGHRILPLVGRAPVDLPGVTIQPVKLPRLATTVVSSDKALYREGSDTVNLVVVDPLRGDGEVVLDLELNGTLLTSRPLALARGVATAALGDLPAGGYSVRVRGADAKQAPCTFTVATYKLSPLVAVLEHQRMDGDKLVVDLRLTTFGTPVTGDVTIELLDEDERIGRFKVAARDGAASASLKLTGDGPHSLNIQIVADPSKTATVPLIGSRAADRIDTVFSTLGAEVLGSLLPSEDAQDIRGVWLRRGATSTSPLMLQQTGGRVRLLALTAIDRLTIVISDPTVPTPADDAIDMRTAPHPISDYEYAQGEKLFQAGEYAQSRDMFAAVRARRGRIHPNYAYFLACAHARLGELEQARAALRTAVEDGWTELEHMRNDEDLANLRADPLFRAVLDGPRVMSATLAADEVLDLELPSPIAVLAVGAYAGGTPWEGYATVLAPSALAVTVEAPAKPKPGAPLTVTVQSAARAAYVIIKDARLASTDTPSSMLASRLKAHASDAGKILGRGVPTTKLSEILPQPVAPMPPPMLRSASVMSIPTGSMMPPSMPGMAGGARGMVAYAAAPMPMGNAAPQPAPMMQAFDHVLESAASLRQGPPAKGAAEPPKPARTIDEVPEVLFAGVVEIANGRGEVTVPLPEAFADYVIEAFALDGGDWAAATTRVRAELEHFVSLDLPAFVHTTDVAQARLTAGGGDKGVTVTVTCDGASVVSKDITARREEITFLVGPGDYLATVTDRATGEAICARKRVDPPGKLRRIARAVTFLRTGDKVALAGDGSLVSLRVLPGLDKPFKLLTDATADYGHACCEQTAAKILAACSMYLFAGDDRRRRDRAEEIILAGVRREHTMWLRGRGFKMYPEDRAEPNDTWGRKTARYLWNLDMLRAGDPSRALVTAIDEALAMARDTTAAYRIAWPPQRIEQPEDAYAALRFQTDARVRESAVSVVKQWAAQAEAKAQRGAVAFRADAAYAAATLLHGGGQAALPDALRLANRVVEALGPEGRLYSTVDSVAAIALMAELQAAKVIGGGGSVRVDGETMPVADAVGRGEVGEVVAVDGTVAVETTRIVEEDWTRFATAVPVTVTLTTNGRVSTRLALGEAVNLQVRLDSGYVAGDLVWVALPDALSRVLGGGQVKRFSVDLAGRAEVTIPLAATGLTTDRNNKEAPQRFAVCVRNMFDEDRAGNPGYLDVSVR